MVKLNKHMRYRHAGCGGVCWGGGKPLVFFSHLLKQNKQQAKQITNAALTPQIRRHLARDGLLIGRRRHTERERALHHSPAHSEPLEDAAWSGCDCGLGHAPKGPRRDARAANGAAAGCSRTPGASIAAPLDDDAVAVADAFCLDCATI